MVVENPRIAIRLPSESWLAITPKSDGLELARLGRDREPTLPRNYGSPELEAIAGSFNEMRHELNRFVDVRLRMVAAISHDLRTPLTQLRLLAEYLPDPEQRRMVLADIGDMEAIVSSTLTFASHQLNKERTGTVDLAALLISIACDEPRFPPRLRKDESLIIVAVSY